MSIISCMFSSAELPMCDGYRRSAVKIYAEYEQKKRIMAEIEEKKVPVFDSLSARFIIERIFLGHSG